MVGPVETFPELFRCHAARLEHHVFPVVLRPIPVENSAGVLVTIEQRGARQRCEHVEVGQFHLVFRQKVDGPLEHRLVVIVEPEHDPGIHHDPVIMEHLDFLRELLHAVKRLVRLIEAVFIQRFHPDEYGHAAALSRELHHFFVIGQEERGLASPLDLERFQRRPELPAIGAVAVVEVVHERHDAAVFDADTDAQPENERLPQRLIPEPFHQLAANPALHVLKFGDHFLHRPASGRLAVKRGYAAELAIEVAASGRKAALSRHVRVGAEQFDARALVVFQCGERRHLIDPLHRARLVIGGQLRPQIFGLAADDRIRMLQRFIRAVRGVDAAHHDGLPPFAEFLRDFIGARRVTGHDRDADHVAGIVEIDVFHRFVDQIDFPMFGRVGRNRRQAQLGKPDSPPLRRREVVLTVPRIGIH